MQAVLPIICIVLVLCFTIAPISPSILLCFLMGAVFILVGMMFFTLGAEMSMTPMGERVGSCLTKSRNLWLIILVSFLLGFIVTISEPDLQVLAGQVPAVPNMVFILSVAVGVGAFLVLALLRMLFGIALPPLLILFYLAVFVLTLSVPADFLSIAFDSGGVTTGPMTVPFIMALGVGISSIRSDRHAADDSFGLIALCSVGPILAVMILSMIYNPQGSAAPEAAMLEADNSRQLWELFSSNFYFSSSHFPIFYELPDFYAAAFQTYHGKNFNWPYIYLCRPCPVFNRSQRRLYAGRELSGPGAGPAETPGNHHPHRHADWLFHRKSRACRIRAK